MFDILNFVRLHGAAELVDQNPAPVNLTDSADVWKVHRGRGLRLALEATQRLRVLGHLVRQNLQSDEATVPISSADKTTQEAAATTLFSALVSRGASSRISQRSPIRFPAQR
jgi:hypothetical protein